MSAPLAVAALAWTLTRPLVHAVLGRLADPDPAQAAFGVALPLLLVTCSPLWALQEAALVLPSNRRDWSALTRFARHASLAASAALALLAWTPAGFALVRACFALPPGLADALRPALALLVPAPLLLAWRAVSLGALLRTGRTRVLLAAAPLRLVLLSAAGFAIVSRAPAASGAVVGLGLMLLGELADAVLAGTVARGALADPACFPAEPAPSGNATTDADVQLARRCA